jgi:uncharacterized protein YdhG (YjbR/CyaY superfamily)
MATKQKSAKSTSASKKPPQVFTDEERAAMKERVKEQKAEARRGADRAEGERDVLAKLAEMPEPDRAMGKRIHAIIKASAPSLSPKTWYGMPAYEKDGKVVCFFQSADKFKAVRNVRVQRLGESGRRRHVADVVRSEEAHCRRGEDDRRARQESGELTH